MKFGYWTSRDRLHWIRVGTVRESSAEFGGKDPRAALWSPLPVWDEDGKRWNLFYVAYHSAPGDGTKFMGNSVVELLDGSFHVTGSNAEAGLAQAIERFALDT